MDHNSEDAASEHDRRTKARERGGELNDSNGSM